MSGIEGRIGSLDRKSYKEITGRGSSIDCAPVFEVASRLQRNPSFGSKHYSTDDVPSATAAVAAGASNAGSAVNAASANATQPATQRPLLAQPSHNMFTAPQPGAKPISIIARNPTMRSSTAGAVTPNIPSSSFLAKLTRPETPTRRVDPQPEPRAVKFTDAVQCNHVGGRCDKCDPENKKAVTPGIVAGSCNHTSNRCDNCDPEKKKPDSPPTFAGSCNHVGGRCDKCDPKKAVTPGIVAGSIGDGASNMPPTCTHDTTTVCSVCAPAKARPLLQRQLTVNDIEKCQIGDTARLVKLYDGKRIISEAVAKIMGLKKSALPDITCAEFDALHAQVMASL